MKVLITGAKGQVGSALGRLGPQSGFEITGLNSVELDIANESAVMAALKKYKPDIVINAAAYTAVDKAENQAEQATRVNEVGAGIVARAVATTGAILVHFSTDYVFDGTKKGAYIEKDTVSPLGVYGNTKLAGERVIQKIGGRYLILRTSWVFGLEGNNFPKTMLRLAAERQEIGVVADQFGCPTFADDIARAVFRLLALYQRQFELPWGLYHYAGSRPCSWHEFASCVLKIAMDEGLLTAIPTIVPLTTSEYPTPARRPANSILDSSLFCRSFPGISLSDWEEGIRRLIESKKSN